MCKYCDGRHANLGVLNCGKYFAKVWFEVTSGGRGHISVAECSHNERALGPMDWLSTQVNFCPWCGRPLAVE